MIPGNIIVKSFKMIGIPNRLDSTEDHVLWGHEDEDEVFLRKLTSGL